MIDVVYILGKGSTWQDNELRYSLRSVEKHLKNYRQVFVIGHRPAFLSPEVVHVPIQDIFANRSRNIMTKIHRACNDPRITKEFILFNDDYFLIKDVSATGYPNYYSRDLKESITPNSYGHFIEATYKALVENDKPTLNFDIHRPIIYDKFKFKKMVSHYNWDIPHGYVAKSMYCNHWGLPGEHIEDLKFNYPHKLVKLLEATKGREMFSTGKKGVGQGTGMQRFLEVFFLAKSKYEI